jgi:pyrroloquinoline quinone (PQQ) biosynthesis protein C
VSSTLELAGNLMDIASYPQWVADVVGRTSELKRDVLDHPIFALMQDGRISHEQIRAFLINGWPVVEQFPQYMAMSLTKLSFGRSQGQDMARRFLTRNLRVEQNHAGYWVDWATGHGLTKADLLADHQTPEALALSHWCWRSTHGDNLAVGMAATNYAIEGVTGEWASFVCESDVYAMGFEESTRKASMRWLTMHAKYDDTHPWEALQIVTALLGSNPSTHDVKSIERAVGMSYRFFKLSLDECF